MCFENFPYECTVIDGGKTFVPTIINYDCRTVWEQFSQSSDNGKWYSFSEVTFKKMRILKNCFNFLKNYDKYLALKLISLDI